MKFDRIIFVSEDAKMSFIKQFSVSTDTHYKLVTQYNIYDSELIKERSKEIVEIEKSCFTICSVSRLVNGKGLEELIHAIEILIYEKQHKEINLWIIGEGPLRKDLEKIVKERKLDEYIMFLGFKSNPFPYMSKSDVIVCPSKSEAFSTVVVEGLILGKAIVSTPVSGSHELLGDSEYGLVTESFSATSIAIKIMDIYSSPTLKKSLEQKASLRSGLFLPQHQFRKTQDLILEVIQGEKSEKQNNK